MAQKVDAEVKFCLGHVKVTVDRGTELALAAIAYQIEGEAKVRAKVDTGFMRNAVYVVEKGSDNYDERRRAAKGVNPKAEMAPRRPLPADAEAAVVAGADYSIFQEVLNPFLYPAAEAVARSTAGVTAEAVYREEIP